MCLTQVVLSDGHSAISIFYKIIPKRVETDQRKEGKIIPKRVETDQRKDLKLNILSKKIPLPPPPPPPICTPPLYARV
jgi:hypothetical protein